MNGLDPNVQIFIRLTICLCSCRLFFVHKLILTRPTKCDTIR